jgi:DNA repair protein RadC
VTPNHTISFEEQPNDLKMLTALRLFQRQITISSALYDENGNNIIRHSVLFHRKINHNIVLLQELTKCICIRKPVTYLFKLIYYIRNILAWRISLSC